jgi:hypothetical protein
MMFYLCALCFLVSPPLPAPLPTPRVAAVADALSVMVNFDLRLLGSQLHKISPGWGSSAICVLCDFVHFLLLLVIVAKGSTRR